MCHCEQSEAISRDCPSTSSGYADHGEPVEPFAPRNDYFSGPFTIVIPKFLNAQIYESWVPYLRNSNLPPGRIFELDHYKKQKASEE